MTEPSRSPAPGALSILLLILVVAAAGWMYLRGVDAGLPFFYHWDEPSLVSIGARVVQEADYHPQWFYYPSLPGYFQGVVYAVAYVKTMGSDESTRVSVQDFPLPIFYAWGRRANVALALLTLVVTALVAGRVSGAWGVGVLAAALLAAMPEFAFEARYITPNVMSTLFGVAAFLPLSHPRLTLGRALGAAAILGLGIGSKYNLAVLLFLLWVPVLRHRAVSLSVRLGWCLGMLATAGLVFLATTPYILIDPPLFLNHFGRNVHEYRVAGHFGAEGTHNLRFFLGHLFRDGFTPPVAVLSLAGGIYLAGWRRLGLHPLVLFPPVYLFLISRFRVNFTRNLLPVYPFLAIWGAFVLWRLLSWLRNKSGLGGRTVGSVLLLGLVLVYPTRRIWNLGTHLQHTDRRTQAREWIVENVPAGSTVLVEAAREPHPYGGYTLAPTIPTDRYQVRAVVDLLRHLDPREFWLREDVILVTCREPGYYRDRFGDGAVRTTWLQDAETLARFDDPAHPGPVIEVFSIRRPAAARRLLKGKEGAVDLDDGALLPFLGSGWESATRSLRGRTYRWSTDPQPEILLPPSGPVRLYLELFGERPSTSILLEGDPLDLTEAGVWTWLDRQLPGSPEPRILRLELPEGARVAISAMRVEAPPGRVR